MVGDQICIELRVPKRRAMTTDGERRSVECGTKAFCDEREVAIAAPFLEHDDIEPTALQPLARRSEITTDFDAGVWLLSAT